MFAALMSGPDFSLMEGDECLRRLLLARENLLTKSSKSRSHRGTVSASTTAALSGDHIILGRASGHPKPCQKWQVKPRRSGRRRPPAGDGIVNGPGWLFSSSSEF